MSWPQWPGGGVPQPGVVQTPIINPAPNVVNPATTLMPTSQYTPEQWAQMQQQNWQQWAQWQQQFQQWQQQYGAEYQKSISALAQTGATPVQPVQPPVPFFNNAPPPLPAETKPPPPPDEPQAEEQFQPPTPVPFPSFTVAPPPVSQATYTNTPQPPQPAPVKEPFPKEFNSNQSAVQAQAHQGGFQNRGRNEEFNQQRYGRNQNYPNNRNFNSNWQNQNNRNRSGFNDRNQSGFNDRNQSGFNDRNQSGFNDRNQSGFNDRNQSGFNDNNFNQPQAAPSNEMETRGDYGVKRPYQSNDAGDPKRNKTESNTENSRWTGTQQHKQRWSEAPPSKPENPRWDTKSSDAAAKANPEELTEAEKKFDKQFADWESQFQKWKEQNVNHPDKGQYREYEKKWVTWRAQLLDRREQMRRKRLGLTGASPQPGNDKPTPKPTVGQEKVDCTSTDLQTGAEKLIQGKTGAVQVGPQVFPIDTAGKAGLLGAGPQITNVGTLSPSIGKPSLLGTPPSSIGKPSLLGTPPPNIGKPSLLGAPPSGIGKPQLGNKQPPGIPNPNSGSPNFSRPPPNLNNQPLDFKPPIPELGEKLQPDLSVNTDDAAPDFLKSASSEGGIPGLDLVKDGKDDPKSDENCKEQQTSENQKPDLEAISRGINSILGDQKLMNMLSLVSQNQSGPPPSNTVDTVSAIRPDSPKFSPEEYNQEDYDEYANQDNSEYYDDQNQNEFGNDDQTQSSFNVCNEEEEFENADYNDEFNSDFHHDSNRFARGPNDWSSGADRFHPGSDNFNRGPDNFNRGSEFNRGIGNFGRGQDNFNRGRNDFNRGSGHFNRGPDNFNRGPDTFNRGPNFNTGIDNFNRGPDNFNKSSDNFNLGGDNFNRGPPNFNRGRGNFNRGSDNLNRSSDNLNKGPGSFDRGPDSFNRGPAGFNRGPDDFNRGPDSFNRRPNPFNRNESEDFSEENKGPDNLSKDVDRSSVTFKRGPDNFNRSSDNFNRGPDNFNRGPDNFNRGSDNLSKDPDSFDNNRDNFNRGFDSFKRGSDTFSRGADFNNSSDGLNRDSDNFNRSLGPNNSDRGAPAGFNRSSNWGSGSFNRDLDKGSNFNNRGSNFEPAEEEKDSDMIKDNNDEFNRFARTPDNFGRRPKNPNIFNEGTKNFDEEQTNFNRVAQNFDGGSFNKGPNNDSGRLESTGFQPPEPDWSRSSFSNDPAPPQPAEPKNDVEKTEEGIWKCKNVTDYDHKSIKISEPEVILEPLRTFDYRHKPLNRIPYPQRPNWLANMVKNYPEFDLAIPRSFETHQLRRYPVNERFDNYQKYEDRDRKQFDDRDRKPYNDRERKPYDDRDRRPSDVRDRKPYEERDRKSFEDRDRKSFEDRDRKSFDDRDRKSFDDRDLKSFEDRDRKSYEDRDRKSYDDPPPRKTFDSKGFDDRRSRDFERDDRKHTDDQKSVGNKKPYSNKDSENARLDNQYESGDDNSFKNKKPNKEQDGQFNADKNASGKTGIPNVASKSNITLIEDLLSPPGRFDRPPRLVIILRGPSGSGKSFLAKLIKDKEVENGGSAPRILCLDDYFMVEQEKEIEEDGRKVKTKEMVYEFEEGMEATYRQSLMKAFKKTIADGYFNFIIVDNINDKVKYFGEMWSFAKQNGFQVYICQMELDVQTCTKRNVHGRSEVEIERCVAGWEPTPAHHPTLDATSLIQSGSIPEVEMEEINSPASENITEEERLITSKWDNFDYSNDNLAKLDGTNKPLRTSKTMEDYLQLDDDWVQPVSAKPGQKRVRWADLEERKKQEKMRAIGFVVGQTNWDRMMDPTMGSGALTQTKYIERYSKY